MCGEFSIIIDAHAESVSAAVRCLHKRWPALDNDQFIYRKSLRLYVCLQLEMLCEKGKQHRSPILFADLCERIGIRIYDLSGYIKPLGVDRYWHAED